MQSVIASKTVEGSFVSYQTLCSTPLLRLVRAARPAIRSRLTSTVPCRGRPKQDDESLHALRDWIDELLVYRPDLSVDDINVGEDESLEAVGRRRIE